MSVEGGQTQYDVIVMGGGAPGEHCAGVVADGGLRCRRGRARAGGRRVLVLGVHPVQEPPAAGRGGARGPRGGGHRRCRRHRRARCGADSTVSNHTDGGQVKWLAGRGIDLVRGSGRLAGTGAVEVDGVRYTAGHVVVATALTRSPRRFPVCKGSPVSGAHARRRPCRRSRAGSSCWAAARPVSNWPRWCAGSAARWSSSKGGPPAGAKPAPLGEALADAAAQGRHRVPSRPDGGGGATRRRRVRRRPGRRAGAAGRAPVDRDRTAAACRRHRPRDRRHHARPPRHPCRRQSPGR